MQEYASFLEKEYCVQTHCYAADLADSQALESLLDTLPDMDVIVNNAGISYVGLLTDMTICDWNQIINTNLTSAFVICRKFLPGMIQRRSGHILNISSVWGNVGASMEVAYSATKGGMNSFTKALAKELGPSNIPVNAIACGIINTSMNACFSEEDLNAIKEEIPDVYYEYDRHSKRQKRNEKEIGIHSIRGGNIVGEHEVIFAGNDEIVKLSHSARSKAIFAQGAVNAAIFLKGKAPRIYNMKDLVNS